MKRKVVVCKDAKTGELRGVSFADAVRDVFPGNRPGQTADASETRVVRDRLLAGDTVIGTWSGNEYHLAGTEGGEEIDDAGSE